jgi:hypothetical protein
MDSILSTAAARPPVSLALDHLVVAARTLDEGEAWLEARLGRGLVAGGAHPGFGTHNRLLRLGDDCYLELIAPDPQQSTPRRLFGLDQEPVARALAREPLLLHTVFRVVPPATLDGLLPQLAYAPGIPTAMSRGDLHWRITLDPTGRLAGDGLLPTLIEWAGAPHPCARLPDAGVSLARLRLEGPRDILAQFPQLSVTGRVAVEQVPSQHSRIAAELVVDEARIIIESALPLRHLA